MPEEIEEEEKPKEEQPTSFTKEQVEERLMQQKGELESSFTEKLSALEQELEGIKAPPKASPGDETKFFPNDYEPKTANEFMGKILEIVEQKFPDMSEKNQEKIVELVAAKQSEQYQAEETQLKEAADTKIQQQVETIKAMDSAFDEKKVMTWFKDNKEKVEGKVTDMVSLYKEYTKATGKSKPAPRPRLVSAPSADESDAPKQVNTHGGNLDKAMSEILDELED